MITLATLVLLGQCSSSYRAATYAAQTYQYAQPTYGYGYQQYYQQPYVEKVVFTAIESPQYYASVIGGALRQEQRAEAAAELSERLQKLTGVVGSLEARLTAPQPQVSFASPQQPIAPPVRALPPPTKLPPPPVAAPPPPTKLPPVPSAQYPTAQAQPTAQAPAQFETPETVGAVPPPPAAQGIPKAPTPSPAPNQYDLMSSGYAVASPANEDIPPAVLTVFQTKCAKCHTEDAASGDFTLFNKRRQLVALGPFEKLRIDQQIYSGAMPKNKPLEPAEYTAVRTWIDQDRDEIALALKQLPRQ